MALTSFISEHTAEYILVPDLIRRLSPRYQQIIPLFFWSTREGNSIAAQAMVDTSVRLLAAFPRRPKVARKHPDHITMKINSSLLDCSRAGTEIGVPVVAGVPLAATFRALRFDSSCAWYNLTPIARECEDCFIEMEADGTIVSAEPPRLITLETLTDANLLALMDASPPRTWDNAITAVRHLRQSVPEAARYPYFSAYRPFYLVVPLE